jgi:hypothetical protein
VLLATPAAGLIWFLVFPLLIPLIVGYVAFGKVLAALAWAPRRVWGRFATTYSHHESWHR